MFLSTSTSANRTVILGTTPLARELVDVISGGAHREYALVGIVCESAASDARPFPCPLLGSLEDLERIFAERRPERVICALAERRRRLPVHQLVSARVCRGVVVESGEEVYERLTGKLAIDSLTPSSVIFSRDFEPSASALALARAISLLVAIVGVVLCAPIAALIALAIKCNSAGPVLFVQDRVGLAGRCFRMLKFRTMYPAAEQRSEWACDNGDRITPVGRWLRRYRLDELPQFVNILRGEMNLIGPRPHPVSNYEMFALVSRNIPECGEQIPYYSLRSRVRPGITGWAQVRYRYANDLDEEMEKMRYDLYFIKHHSVLLDLRILLETIKVIFAGPGERAAGVPRPCAAHACAAPVARTESIKHPTPLVKAHEVLR
jgi:exopolysaccharide biosynthesis polyprenyl glycosylphosphotransferase